MISGDEMRRMARWNRWANRVVGEVLIAAGGVPKTALRAFQHIFEAEVTWLRRFDGSNGEMIPLWKSASLDKALGAAARGRRSARRTGGAPR